MSDHNRIVCQVESLGRINIDVDIDCIIFDELNTIFSHISGDSTSRNNCHKIMIDIMKNQKGIYMDAYLSSDIIEFVNNISERQSNPVINNIYKSRKDDVFEFRDFHPNSKADKQNIISKITEELKKDRRVVFHTNIKATSNDIVESIKMTYPNKKIVHYHGDNYLVDGDQYHYDKKVEDFKNVNESFDCDLLVYTTTLVAGVSCDDIHFDTYIGALSVNPASADYFVQGIGRVRNFKQKKHYIYCCNDVAKPSPMTPYEIHKTDINNIGGRNIYKEDYTIQCFTRARNSVIANFPRSYVKYCLQVMGAQVNICNSSDDKNVSAGVKVLIAEKYNGQCEFCDFKTITEILNNDTKDCPDVRVKHYNDMKILYQKCGINAKSYENMTDQMHRLHDNPKLLNTLQIYQKQFGHMNSSVIFNGGQSTLDKLAGGIQAIKFDIQNGKKGLLTHLKKIQKMYADMVKLMDAVKIRHRESPKLTALISRLQLKEVVRQESRQQMTSGTRYRIYYFLVNNDDGKNWWDEAKWTLSQ